MLFDADPSTAPNRRMFPGAQRAIVVPVTLADLQRAGYSRVAVDRFVASGALRRLRRGWYAEPQVDPRLADVVAAKGTLTCASALALAGAWSVADARTHARFTESSAPGPWRATSPLVRHGSLEATLPSAATTLIDRPLDALACAVRCLPEEPLAVVTDSLLNRGMVAADELDCLTADLPPAKRRKLQRVDGRSQAGSETRVRLLLLSRGYRVQPQFEFRRRQFADLLADDWLVIELDSVAHHSDAAAYRKDRARTLALQELGYTVVRLTYDDVWVRWDSTVELLVGMLRAGRRRRRPPRPESARGRAAG